MEVNFSWFRYLIIVCLVILFQTVLLNHLILFHVALPVISVYLLMLLPMEMNKSLLITIGFILGMLLDLFNNSMGANALAMIVTALIRPFILYVLVPREKQELVIPSLKNLRWTIYSRYTLFMVVVYLLVLFGVESVSTMNFGYGILKYISSVLFTWATIVGIELLQQRKKE